MFNLEFLKLLVLPDKLTSKMDTLIDYVIDCFVDALAAFP